MEWDLSYWLPWFSGLRVWTGATALGFLGYQLADSISWGFSASIIMTPSLIINPSIFILAFIIIFTEGQNPDKFTNVKLYCFIFSNFTPG